MTQHLSRLDVHAALKALSHEGRRDFLIRLKTPGRSFGLASDVVDMGVPAGRFQWEGLSQSASSQHLSILERAGLLKSWRCGNTILYSRNEENIAKLKRWFEVEL